MLDFLIGVAPKDLREQLKRGKGRAGTPTTFNICFNKKKKQVERVVVFFYGNLSFRRKKTSSKPIKSFNIAAVISKIF